MTFVILFALILIAAFVLIHKISWFSFQKTPKTNDRDHELAKQLYELGMKNNVKYNDIIKMFPRLDKYIGSNERIIGYITGDKKGLLAKKLKTVLRDHVVPQYTIPKDKINIIIIATKSYLYIFGDNDYVSPVHSYHESDIYDNYHLINKIKIIRVHMIYMSKASALKSKLKIYINGKSNPFVIDDVSYHDFNHHFKSISKIIRPYNNKFSLVSDYA